MSDLISLVANLRRPRLLIRAARFGMADYSRSRDLKRLTHSLSLPASERAVTVLLAEEQRVEETRRTGDASYSLSRHIELLIALMAEIRLVARKPAQA